MTGRSHEVVTEAVLKSLRSPRDLEGLSVTQLEMLADEVRQALIKSVTTTGGHLGSNLGFVEATIALHRVFDVPTDKLVFDVSHQSYTHKMLTGRADAYTDPAHYGDVSGFTDPAESPYDFFRTGHTSTSISLACGLAKARDLAGESHNVIAVIGDGSLSGGEAFEGLDNAATLSSNLIVILNDNEMSIATNVGGIYGGLSELRASGGTSEHNIFRDMGLDYVYVEEGNDVAALVEAFERVRDIDHPVVVHIHTLKGKGLAWAEQNKEASHSVSPEGAHHPQEELRVITREFMLAKMAADSSVVVVNAATPGGTGLSPEFRVEAGDQFVDVGICEQHAISFAAGLARGGAKPVFFVASTFLQRGYDQLVQDLALNRSPVVVLVWEAGFSALDATHVGVFDVGFTGNIPGLLCLSPATKGQYLAMLDWAIEQTKTPVVIRVPHKLLPGISRKKTINEKNVTQFEVSHAGSRVALIGLGPYADLMEDVARELRNTLGVDPTTICAPCYSELDVTTLDALEEQHDLVVTFENGVLYGGFGEKVARYYGPRTMRTLCYGGIKEFLDRVPADKIRERYHLEPPAIVSDIARELGIDTSEGHFISE